MQQATANAYNQNMIKWSYRSLLQMWFMLKQYFAQNNGEKCDDQIVESVPVTNCAVVKYAD